MPKVKLRRLDYATRQEFRQAIHNQWTRKRKASKAITLEASRACGELMQGRQIAKSYEDLENTVLKAFEANTTERKNSARLPLPEKQDKAKPRVEFTPDQLRLLNAEELAIIHEARAKASFKANPYRPLNKLKIDRERAYLEPEDYSPINPLEQKARDNKRLSHGQSRIYRERITQEEHALNQVNQVNQEAELKRDKNLPDYVDLRIRQAEAKEKEELKRKERMELRLLAAKYNLSLNKDRKALEKIYLSEHESSLRLEREKSLGNVG